jgi:hypothetical protein
LCAFCGVGNYRLKKSENRVIFEHQRGMCITETSRFALLGKYWCDHIDDDEMDKACSKRDREEKAHEVLVGKNLTEKTLLGKPRR